MLERALSFLSHWNQVFDRDNNFEISEGVQGYPKLQLFSRGVRTPLVWGPCVVYSIWGNEVTLFNEKQTNEMSVFLEFLNLIKLRIGNTAITKEFLTILVSFPLTLLAAMLYLYCPCVYCVIIVNMYIDMQIQSKFISFTVNSDAQEQTKQYTHCDLTTP